MLPEEKPAINLNFSDPSVKKLTLFIQSISEKFKDEPNLPITVKVLECLIFIKLNFPWISYAIRHKENDNTIYAYTQDRTKQVLRAHNDMSFHIIMYQEPEKAISDYQSIITAIEDKIDLLLENSAYTKTFIRKIQDSAVGCMEARLELALNYIVDPSIPKLDDIFQDFFAEQTQLGIASEDIDKFIPHLTNYFADKIGEELTHAGKPLTLSWSEVKEYLDKFFGYDEELKPLNLFKDAIITQKKNNYLLNLPNQKLAEKYLNLIQISLPNDLYLPLKKTNIINIVRTNSFVYYNFQLNQEQFHIITILLEASVNDVVSKNEPHSLIPVLQTALTNSFEVVKSTIHQYPALKNFIINNNGETLVHYYVRTNQLEPLKVLLETYQLDINAQIDRPNTYTHGMTSVLFACYLASSSREILEYLLQAGADVNIPNSKGVMPLEQLAFSSNQEKLKILLTYRKEPKGDMSLLYAIEKDSIEVLQQLLLIPGININYKNTQGESALFLSAKNGNIQKLRLLLAFEDIDLETSNKIGKTAIQIARDNGYQQASQLIYTQLKSILEAKASLAVRQDHSFANYALTLHKVPTEDLYISYLKDLITLNTTQDKVNAITQKEAHSVQSRKLWNDVVSETYLANQQYCQENKVKEQVIQRLKALNVEYPQKTYLDCMTYLREDSVITLSFDAAFLKKGLVDLQPLNVWQRDNKTSSYKTSRDAAERGMFSFLSEPLRTALFDNKDARPRYAACWLPDKNTTRPHAALYGNSFLVLKDTIKLNSIFSPGNPLGFKSANQKDYKVCTIHDLDLLLLQCQPATLQAIVNKVINGELKADNYDQNVIWQNDKGGHFEAMIPAFHFLNSDFVEHIHIDPIGYVLSAEEKAQIESLGIKVSNSHVPPYEELGKKFTHAKKGNAEQLLEQYPLLRKIFEHPKLPNHLLKLKELLKKLNDFASKKDFNQFNATWNQLTETGVIKEVTRNLSDYFNDFANNSFESVFTKLLENKDETLAKLFIDSKLVHMGHLLNNFLYPKQGSAKDSLFYNYIRYGVENKNATFLNLLFSQIPKSHRDDFMGLFKTECIDYLDKIDSLLALKLLVFLKRENFLDLKQGIITPESNRVLQAEYVIHILYVLMHSETLSPLQIDFLEKCPIMLLSNLLQILLHQHTVAEVSHLINADILREKFTDLCEKNDQIFYAIHLEKTMLDYQKKLETLALAGSFADFKENWEKIIDLNHQYTKQINKNFYWVANTIFKSAIKGRNTEIVRLMLENYIVDIYYLHKNIGTKNSTEPLGYFNAISLAVYMNDLHMLTVLSETKINFDFYSKQQTVQVMQNPLAIAISNDNRDMVNLLLEKKLTIFHQEENFYASAMWTALTMDFKYNKESAYYFNLLLNKMTEQSKSDFLEKCAEYLPGLTANYTDEAGWLLNLLLKKDYLNIDDLLRNNELYNSAVFCPILLEKIIHLNMPSAYQIKFLKKNKANLNKLVAAGMDINLFSNIELEQLSNQASFFSLLNEALQKKIIESFKIEQCKHRLLTLALVKEIIDFTDTQLEQTKKSPVYREKVLKYHIFYQEIKNYITQVDLRFKEKKLNDDTELDFAEMQTLSLILEDSQQTTTDQEESWYSPPLQLAIKQFCNIPSLNALSKNPLKKPSPLSIDKLPTLNQMLQEAVEKYRAYRLVMWPAVEKHIQQFPLDEADQVLDFILPRVAEMPYKVTDTTGTLVQKVIHRTEIENYLQTLFSFDEDASFILVPEESTTDLFTENFIEVDPIECGPVVTEPKAGDPRLNSTLLENLLLSYIEGPASKKYQVSQGMIEIIGKYNIHTYYKKLHRADNIPIFVFQVARDSNKEEQNINLPFINDVITSYVTQNPGQDVKLLIPMAQCRLQLVRKKQHYVLVEVTIKGEKRDIVLHNSKSASSSFAYRNCLKDLKYNSLKNSHYNQQGDDISCGFYVYNYIKSILETGNTNELPTIRVTLQAMVSNPSLLNDLLNDNFTQMQSDAREIREIGESLPWESELLKEMLNKDYEEKLKYLSKMIDKQEMKKKPNHESGKQNSAHSSLSSTSRFFKKNPLVSTLGEPSESESYDRPISTRVFKI